MIAPAPAEMTVPPQAVADFARDNGVAACIRPILAVTGQCFPGCPVVLRLEEDAEVDSDTYILIEVDVSGWSADEMFSAWNRWSDEFCRTCAPENSFVFQIRLVQNA